MSILSDYQRHVVKPMEEAHATRVGKLTTALAAAQSEATRLRDRVQALEGALGKAILQIEYLHGKFGETGSGNGVLAQIRALLSPREGA